MAPTASRLAPLRVPRFRALWAAGFLSWYGDFLSLPALLIIAYQLGGEFGVGMLFVFQTVPLLGLLPIGGQMGDQGDRRRRLVALDVVRASLAALMIISAQGHLLLVLVLAVAASRSASALYDPGRRRLVPVLLPPELVGAGGSLLSVVGESSILVAPAVGAALLLVVSPSVLIFVDGCTFLVSASLLSRLGSQPSVWTGRVATAKRGWRQLRRGFDLLLLDRTISLFAIQAGMGALVAGVVTVYFVPIAHRSLHLPTDQVGLMYVIVGGASVGGSLLALRRPQVGRRGLVVIGYIHLLVAILVGSLLGPVVVVGALIVFAGTGALQEVWGFNRLQTTTPRDGIGQAFGAALWFQFLGRAVGAGLGAWGASHLAQVDFFYILVVVAVAFCLLATLSRSVFLYRSTSNWPPSNPPLPLEP